MRRIGIALLATSAFLAAGFTPAARAYDGTWLTWTSDPGTPYGDYAPIARWAAATDTRRGRVLVFGGASPSYHLGPGAYTTPFAWATTVAYSLADGAVMLQAGGVAAPSPRVNAAVAYDSTADRLWLYGGAEWWVAWNPYGGVLHYLPVAELSSLDLAQSPPVWTSVAASVSGPQARFGHGMVFDPVAQRLLVFGGQDTTGARFGDLWSLPLDGSPATQLAPAGPAPPPSLVPRAQYDAVRRRLLLVAPDTLWSLALGDPLQWHADPIGGTSPSGSLTGWDIDTNRDRLLAFSDPGAVYELPLGATPAWRLLQISTRLASPPAYAGAAPQVGYDAAHDGLVVAHSFTNSYVYQQATVGCMFVAFDSALVAGNTTASLDSAAARTGRLLQWWSFDVNGVMQATGTLQRREGGGAWSDVASFAPPALSQQIRLADATAVAGHTYDYRVGWLAYAGMTFAAPVTLTAPPPPVAMAASVDSAVVIGGVARLQWTLANDSLSYVVEPTIARWSASQGWVDLGAQWPDAQRRLRLVDTAVVADSAYRYQVRWPTGSLTVSTGDVQLTIPGGAPALAEAAQFGRDTYARWHVAASGPATVHAYRRTRAAAAWALWDTLNADAAGNVVIREHALPFATHVEYVIGWPDQGSEVYASPAVFDVPGFMAVVDQAASGTQWIRLTWSVAPVDSLSLLRIWRWLLPSGSPSVIAGPVVIRSGTFSLTDTTVTPGSTYSYAPVGDDGTQLVSASPFSTGTADVPRVLRADVAGSAVALAWTLTRDANAYQVWRRLDDGAHVKLADLAAPAYDASGRVSYDDTFDGTPDSVAYRLAWRESDLAWRTAPDTTLRFERPPAPPAASFAVASANPSTTGLVLAYGVPDNRTAHLRVYDLDGRCRLSRTTAGAGRYTWTIAPGELRPGVYWVRYEHPGLKLTRRVVVLK